MTKRGTSNPTDFRSKSKGFEGRLPPRLSFRLRRLLDEPSFNILLGEGSGRVTFEYVLERLTQLAPWVEDEQAGLVARVSDYITRQLQGGTPGHLKGVDTLFEALEVEDLPLDPGLVERLEKWLTHFPLEQLKVAAEGFSLRGEREGQYFESALHNDFIPNWVPDGLEHAKRIFAHRYLSHHNAYVKEKGIEPEELDPLMRARPTLEALSAGPGKRRPGKRVLPKTVRELLRLLKLETEERAT